MAFIPGFLLGMLVLTGLLGFLACWLYSRSNGTALVRFMSGMAQALAHRANAPESPQDNGKWRSG